MLGTDEETSLIVNTGPKHFMSLKGLIPTVKYGARALVEVKSTNALQQAPIYFVLKPGSVY